jgi:hypothetical protein
MVQLNKRAYAEFDNMVQLKRYYGSTKTPGPVVEKDVDGNLVTTKRGIVRGY